MSYYKDEDPSKWRQLKLFLWAAWAALVLLGFAALEYMGLKKKRDDHPPLTYTIRRYVPAWMFFTGLFGLFGWLIWHFIQTYLNL